MEESKIDSEKVNKVITIFVNLVNKGLIDDLEKCCSGEMTKRDIYEKYIDDIVDGEKDGKSITEEEEHKETKAEDVQREENEYQNDEITLKDIYGEIKEIKKSIKILEDRVFVNKYKDIPKDVPKFEEPKTRTWKKAEPPNVSKTQTGGANPKRTFAMGDGTKVTVDFSDLLNVIDDLENKVMKKEEPKKFDSEKMKEAIKIAENKSKKMWEDMQPPMYPGKTPDKKRVVTRTYIFNQ